MHVKKNQPILVRVLKVYQTFLFFTWNFVNRLKQTFLQITFSLLADRVHQNSISFPESALLCPTERATGTVGDSYMIPIVYRYIDSYTALFLLLVYRGTWPT